MCSFKIGKKQQKQSITSRFSFKGLKKDLFNFTNILKNDLWEEEKDDSIKIQKKESLLFKGITKKKPTFIKQNIGSFFYQSPKKILPTFKILTPSSTLTYQYEKQTKEKKYEIAKNISFNFDKNDKVADNSTVGTKEAEEKLKKMIEDLNNSIKSKEEEIKKVEKEKADMEMFNQLFTESSNEQIEKLKNENKENKEKNEKLTEENKTIKEELEQKKTN
jgi:hypothetical protein